MIHFSAVYTHIIAGGVAPALVCVVIVIAGTAFIRLLYGVACFIVLHIILFRDPADTCVQI